MLHISGYRLTEQIAAQADVLVYRAYSERDNQPVVLKLPTESAPGPQQLARFQHEYALLSALDAPEIIRCYRLEQVGQRPVLVLEDFGGTALSQLGLAGQLPLEICLRLAIAAVTCVAQVHRAQLVHKDINPANLVYNPDTGQLKLIDFGLATRLRRAEVTFQSPISLEGTLAYISPEQTGRMNRLVDYRTDLYSLGVTLYELLTGQRPFASDDPLELVHAHLARLPQPPHAVNPLLPPALSAIVLKLLAKSADDRYQSAHGLAADLTYCLDHLDSPDDLAGFVPVQHDRIEQLQIPQTLYGREADVAELLDAFARTAAGGCELLLVAGPSGIGKTMLVDEIHRPVTIRRGSFAAGKFDQYQRTTPYLGWTQAFTSLVQQLLIEGEAQLASWRDTILAAVGDNGRLITDMIPLLEAIIGPQPDVPALVGLEAQHRFELTFGSFVQALVWPDHPLVLFLDDLQWADAASLQMLQMLLGEVRPGGLLVIGAYRDNEVAAGHPLTFAVDGLHRAGAAITTRTLAPFSQGGLNRLVADALGCAPEVAQPLGDLVYQKTHGNPFLTTQLLHVLCDEGMLCFNPDRGQWECDLDQVRSFTLTDDVAAFMAQQVRKLPRATQELVMLAACVGSRFDLETLAVVAGRSAGDIAAALWDAVQVGLLVRTREVHHFGREPGAGAVRQERDDTHALGYRFVHDQVQQAAVSLVTEDERQAIHLRIGRRLLEHTAAFAQPAQLFALVHHLNQGSPLLTAPDERNEVARLNLQVGQQARAVAAFGVARIFFTTGLALLGAESWRHTYDLMLRLTERAAEAAYLCGDFAEMERLSASVLAEAHSPLDTVAVYEVQIQGLLAQNKIPECVRLGLRALRQFGVALPEQPGQADVGAALQATQAAWQTTGIAALIDLQPMTARTELAAIRLCSDLIPAAFLCSPMLYVMLTLTQVNLSIRYGNTAISSYSYACYAQLLCGVLGDIETGYQFGQLAVDLLRRLDAKEFECKVQSTVYAFVNHWKAPIRDSLLPIRASHHSGLETGDLQFAAYAAVMYPAFMYYFGIEWDLARVRREAAALSETIARTRQTTSYQYMQIGLQALDDMIAGRASSIYLQGVYYDEPAMLPRHLEANDGLGLFFLHSNKLLLNYLFGEYEQAVRDAAQAEAYLDCIVGFPYGPLYVVYDSLARLAAYRRGHGDPQELQQRVAANQAKVAGWAQHAPVNWRHTWDLVEAERQRVFGDKWTASEAYDRAIAGAEEHGYLRESALANELAAAFYLDCGREQLAQVYMQAAHTGYTRWGAAAKAAQLERQYARLLAPVSSSPDRLPAAAGSALAGRTSTIITTPSVSLDLVTVIKASEAIVGEIELPRLLTQLMRIVLENAGAQRGALIVERAGQWVIAAEGDVDHRDIAVLQACDLQTSTSVAAGIVSYVLRTRESVVLNNAAGAGPFTGDPYIHAHQTKSVLCTPLLNQGAVSGILYLENNLTSEAFTPSRVALLKVLSAQMAMALDNARGYADLEAKVIERTRELVVAKAAAEQANDLKTKFLTNMSHELRTPLNAIINFTHFLSKERYGPLTAPQTDLQRRILNNAEHLLGLINDILDLSKIEAGRMELFREPTDLLSMLQSVMATAGGLAKEKELSLNLEAPEELPQLMIDKTRIRQVLLNLLSNAAKFTQRGEITVRAAVLGDMIEIAVVDTGIGIAPEQQALVFEAFQQIDSELARQHRGSGLGLPISKKFVEMHGGQMWLESRPGHGSTFAFTLPLTPGIPRAVGVYTKSS